MPMIEPKPILYVCAPWATRTPDEAALTDLVVKQALALGWAPIFPPYALERAIDEKKPGERELALACCVGFLAQSEALVVVGERTTAGMRHDLAAWGEICGAFALTYTWPDLPGPESFAGVAIEPGGEPLVAPSDELIEFMTGRMLRNLRRRGGL